MSKPARVALPPLLSYNPVRIEINVLFPAPLGLYRNRGHKEKVHTRMMKRVVTQANQTLFLIQLQL